MGLVVSPKLSSVAKSGSCSTDAFSELSSALPVSHPPTLAASCLQTDLLVKWRKPSLYAFVSGKGGGKPVFLEEGSWGCLDQENRILFKKRRFYRLVAPSFNCYPLLRIGVVCPSLGLKDKCIILIVMLFQ